jgi:hypothetical protein
LDLHKGENTDANYVLTKPILDNDELLDVLKAALQIVGGEIGGCSHCSLLNALQVREFAAFVIEDAITVALYVKKVMGHGAPPSQTSIVRSLTHGNPNVCLGSKSCH